MIRIGRGLRHPPRQDKSLALRCARAAFVGVAAVHDRGGVVERTLEELLVGVVAIMPSAETMT